MVFVKIYAARDEIEASVIQGVLRVYGVESAVKDKSLKNAGYPGVAGTKGSAGVEIWVDQDQVDLALKVLQDDSNASGSRDEPSQENINGFLTRMRNWLRNN